MALRLQGPAFPANLGWGGRFARADIGRLSCLRTAHQDLYLTDARRGCFDLPLAMFFNWFKERVPKKHPEKWILRFARYSAFIAHIDKVLRAMFPWPVHPAAVANSNIRSLEGFRTEVLCGSTLRSSRPGLGYCSLFLIRGATKLEPVGSIFVFFLFGGVSCMPICHDQSAS